jgi:hypothetical protein
MDSIISQFISEWGTLGVVLFAIGWMAWDNWKSNKARNSQKNETLTAVNNLGTKIDNLDDKIKLVNHKVDEFKNQVDDKIEILEAKVDAAPDNHILKNEMIKKAQTQVHLKQMDDLMKLGPKLHRIIQNANQMIGSDHIFVGSFHNGNSSLSGIPYYKFDIIAERFSPNKVSRDCEFAHMYKDADILRFDTLPSLLEQKGLVHFEVPAEGELEMAKFDDIIWRRMRGRGIKQIALRLTRDSKGSPSGFVGIVKYDEVKMDLKALENCAVELEEIYHEAEIKN